MTLLREMLEPRTLDTLLNQIKVNEGFQPLAYYDGTDRQGRRDA